MAPPPATLSPIRLSITNSTDDVVDHILNRPPPQGPAKGLVDTQTEPSLQSIGGRIVAYANAEDLLRSYEALPSTEDIFVVTGIDLTT
jgi:hypothetical protein